MENVDRKPNGYWTYENCRQEASEFQTKSEFKKKYSSAYSSACKNKWIDDVCSHMIEIIKPNGYWDYENCLQESLKYKSRNQFRKKSGSAYEVARKNNWLDEVCSHMEIVGNLKKRGIYAFEFQDNSVYIGLTYDFNKRYDQHLNKIDSAVYKYINKTGLTPVYYKLTDYMDEELASKEEGVWVDKYRKDGWKILNKTKTGGLGGDIIKWDYENCHQEALKFKSRGEFQKKSKCAYDASWKNNWLDDVCSHMIEIRKPNGYWTYENCRQESLKFKSRGEFKKNSGSAYRSALKNNWLDEFFPK